MSREMVVTVFRSRLHSNAGEEYAETAARMRELAETMPGFVSFKTFRADDGERVSLIEFESEEAMATWRNHPEHLQAQQRGRESFYAEFQIQVCSVVRQYGFKRQCDTRQINVNPQPKRRRSRSTGED